MALLLVLLVEGLGTLAAVAMLARIRLARDDRWATEGWLVARSALAEARVTQQAALDAQGDEDSLALGWVTRADGWRWRADALREGALVRLVVVVERWSVGGELLASRRVTLLLHHPPSDTVRVLAHRAVL